MIYSALALDQSMTSTGWAHIGNDTPITFGTFNQPNWMDDEGRHLWDWWEWLGHKCVDLKVTHLWFETPFVPPSHDEKLTERMAQYGLPALACMTQYVLTEKRGQPIKIFKCGISEWRHPFTGCSKAPEGFTRDQKRTWWKRLVMENCHKRGWLVGDDNAGDACGILTHGVTTIDMKFMVQQGPLFRRAEMAVDNEKRELK